MKRRHGLALACGMLTCLALFVSACSGTGTSDGVDGLAGIELERLDDGTTMAMVAPGQARVLNLWATWCAPCRAELPAFDAVATDLTRRSSDVSIIGINVGDTGSDAAALVEELGLSFDQVLDPKAQVQRELRITGMPATIFVSAGGDVLEIHNGELTQDELEMLLGEQFGVDFDRE